MAQTQSVLLPYLTAIRRSLQAALCLRNFASQEVERHNKPEIETQSSPEVIARPITITRTETEYVYIETSINSVRISVKVKQLDNVDVLLAKMFMRFLAQRADSFRILRRKPVPGYDISFLVTNIHVEQMVLSKLIEFIVAFLQDVDKELSDMKVTLNARARVCAEEYLKGLV
jgi:actin related protein 2/3 complex subunit 4